MNNLYKSKVYLAGNIQNSNESTFWREGLTKDLSKMGIVCLNPRVNCFLNQIAEDDVTVKSLKADIKEEKYDKAHDALKQIIRRDLRMVDMADFLIVNIEPTLPTYGTVHEIVVASIQRKPILFRINDKRDFPLWLLGLIDHSLIFMSFAQILIYLEKINSSPVEKLDNKYWKIFSEEYR